MYAVHIGDLVTYRGDYLVRKELAPVIEQGDVIDVGEEGLAVTLACGEEEAARIVKEFLLSGYHPKLLRFYRVTPRGAERIRTLKDLRG